MLPFEEQPIEEEEEIDPFEELQIGNRGTQSQSSDPLSAFENDTDPLAAFDSDDPLSAFEDDGMETEEVVISFDDEVAPEISPEPVKSENKSEATYKLLLETVWVDDILDPSEVELLARKRRELGLTFERHLQLVRDIIEA